MCQGQKIETERAFYEVELAVSKDEWKKFQKDNSGFLHPGLTEPGIKRIRIKRWISNVLFLTGQS